MRCTARLGFESTVNLVRPLSLAGTRLPRDDSLSHNLLSASITYSLLICHVIHAHCHQRISIGNGPVLKSILQVVQRVHPMKSKVINRHSVHRCDLQLACVYKSFYHSYVLTRGAYLAGVATNIVPCRKFYLHVDECLHSSSDIGFKLHLTVRFNTNRMLSTSACPGQITWISHAASARRKTNGR
ncbi:hypothetical protein M405DRAFT_292617 [Rhizopogon salebrosus TDB-379]|nr:hypothetical protein M405DRAFT_292617 [Rhizopogon salebrosus TDB-379]